MGTPGVNAAVSANAIKALGILVEIEPQEFERLVRKIESPLVVHAEAGMFSKKHRYLMGHKGLAFYTTSTERLSLPIPTDIVESKKITIPSY